MTLKKIEVLYSTFPTPHALLLPIFSLAFFLLIPYCRQQLRCTLDRSLFNQVKTGQICWT